MNSKIEIPEEFKEFTDSNLYNNFVTFDNLCSLWEISIAKYSNKTALEYEGAKLTYKDLGVRVSQLRSALVEYGCKKGDKIAILCNNSIECVCSLFAVVTLGGVAVMIPPYYNYEEISTCWNNLGLSAIVYERQFADIINKLKTLIPNSLFIKSDQIGLSNSPIVTPNKEDPCVIVFTGGTTGKSKGVILSHKAIVRATINGCFGIKNIKSQKFLLLLPLFHVFGLIRNLLPCLYIGGDLYLSSSEKNIIQDIKTFKPTIIAFVPLIAEVALDLYKRLGNNIFNPEFKTVFIGAVSVPQYLIEEYSKIGIDIFPGYGMTETAGLVFGNPKPLEKINSVGIPYPHEEIKIVEGELWLRGDNLLTDYIGTKEHAWNEEGWFQTGDLARIDDDGYVYITGRIKDVIILKNGENVYPAELEAKFNELNFIKDSEVYAETNGEEEFLALDVVLRDTTESEEKILEKLWEINNQQKSTDKVKKINIRKEDFRRTTSKKIVRRKND